VKEARRFGWSDPRILSWATAEGGLVATHDKDFAGLLRNPMDKRHAGVIFLQLHNQHATHVAEKLRPVVSQLRARRLRNALVIIGEESVEYLRG
jgi:predicted nuclease of predicted toxin-antitoxin system